MTNPAVSVLMPLYNCASFLPAALRSLTSQTLTDFEIIAVDDGSMDETGPMLDAFAAEEPRCRVIRTSNRGIVAALNTAACAARGSYFARFDGDDIARHDRFAEQVAFLDSHPSCVCVGSLCRLIDERGEVFAEQKPFARFRQTDLSAFPPHVASPSHPSIMMRRSAFEAIGGYRAAFPLAEDHDLFLRLARLGRIDLVQKALLDYRVHRSSLSSNGLERQVDSALCAVLSAVVVSLGRPDPAEHVSLPTREDFYDVIADHEFTSLFEDYRLLAQVHGEMNRFRRLAALRRLFPLGLKLIGSLPFRASDDRFRSLMMATVRSTARLALGKV